VILTGRARRVRPGRRGDLTSTARSAARKACTFAFCRARESAPVSYLVSSIHPRFHNWYKTLKIAQVVGAWSSGGVGVRRRSQVRRRHTLFSPFRYGGVARFRAVAWYNGCAKLTKLLPIALRHGQLK